MRSDLIFPRFGGYSPVLPAPINNSILSLFQEAMDPNRPRSGPERNLLEVRRALSFELLHKYFEARTHQLAVDLIRRLWSDNGPFCLYLRNFGLGASSSAPEIVGTLPDQATLVVRGVDMLMNDELFQRALVAHVAPRLPVIGIENPAFDFRGQGFPKLQILGDEWRAVVNDLICAAEVIVVYFDKPTRGVGEELAMIRAAGRQSATVLAVSTKEGTSISAPDFPIQLPWSDDAAQPDLLTRAIASIPAQQLHKRFAPNPPAVPAPAAPPAIRLEAEFVVNAGLSLAGQQFRENKLVDMEDRLSVCLAMAFWGDIPEARMLAFLWIARSQLCRQWTQYATANLDRALDIGERLLRQGQPASSLRVVFADAMSTFAEFHGDAKAQAAIARARQLIDERIRGPDHPDTLTSRNNLAYAYQAAGRLDEAIALYEQTLADYERVLGADHPDTLSSPQQPRLRLPDGGAPGRGDRAVRADPHRQRAGAGRRPPRYPGLPQQPRQRLPDGGAPRRGDPAVRAHPRRPRAGAGRRPPRHPDLPQQPRLRLPDGRARSTRRSRCTSRPSPTASGCWAPTTPTP